MDIQTLARFLINRERLAWREKWTREQLLSYQAASFAKLRRYVYQHSPFYQEFHRGLEDAPLEALAVLTKQNLMENFDRLVTDPTIRLNELRTAMKTLQEGELYHGRYWVNLTSGTSGEPGIFLCSRAEWAMLIVASLRGLGWGGWELHFWQSRKEAIVASKNPQHMSMQIAFSAQKPWTVVQSIGAAEPVEEIVAKLNRFQPDYLVAYSLTAKRLAEEQATGRLKIKPRAIFATAEVLSTENRRFIESVWGKILFNHYASTEAGSMAAECSAHRGLHLFEDLCIFEIVDADNQPVPAGTYGEKLLVTVLFKYLQPLIRYEITDSLRLIEGTCALGHPFRMIDAIQGRLEEVLYLPGNNGSKVAVHPNIFHDVMDSLPLQAWQIVQTETGIQVLLQGLVETFSDTQVIDPLKQALINQGIGTIQLEVQRADSIAKSANGKTALIKAIKN